MEEDFHLSTTTEVFPDPSISSFICNRLASVRAIEHLSTKNVLQILMNRVGD